MSRAAAEMSAKVAEGIWTSHTNRDRTLLALGAIICYWLSGTIAAALSIPRFPKFDAALLHQPSPVLVVIVAFITLILCTLLGSLIAGSVHFEGGLFCAVVGLAAFSVRGGPMRHTLFNA